MTLHTAKSPAVMLIPPMKLTQAARVTGKAPAGELKGPWLQGRADLF